MAVLRSQESLQTLVWLFQQNMRNQRTSVITGQVWGPTSNQLLGDILRMQNSVVTLLNLQQPDSVPMRWVPQS